MTQSMRKRSLLIFTLFKPPLVKHRGKGSINSHLQKTNFEPIVHLIVICTLSFDQH